MKIVQEITAWKDITYQAPNHVYLMDGDKAYGYSKWGTGPAEYFRKPLRLDRRGRKFVEVKKNSWKFNLTLVVAKEEPEKPQGQVWTVAGSKGNQYFVNLSTGHWSCTCAGHGFRGKCRHVDEIAKTLA
jgi:hypothetical protein